MVNCWVDCLPGRLRWQGSLEKLMRDACVVLAKIHALPFADFFPPLGNCDSTLHTTEEWKYGAPQLLKLSLLFARYVA